MARAGTMRASMLALALVAAACTPAPGDEAIPATAPPPSAAPVPEAAPRPTTSTTTTSTSTTVVAAPARRRPAPPSTTPVTAPSGSSRLVIEPAWAPFARSGEVTLVHPSSRVERIGFHESNHEGARELEPLATAASPTSLESRSRGTGQRTAADVVVDPDAEIRSPVTGRVKRGGRYVLYCKNHDHFVVIEPEANPGWEVKILHMDGLTVRAGQRVVAGQTVLAPRARKLPFASQVDELSTADHAWPHVHIEVVDPSIPNRPSPGGGCR